MPGFRMPPLPCNGVLCRYSEIAMKGRNRMDFENLLGSALAGALADLGEVQVVRERGRIFLLPPEGSEGFSPADVAVIRECLPRVPGLSSASPGLLVEPNFGAIEEAVNRTFPAVYDACCRALPADEPVTYSMRCRRSNKRFPMTSAQLEIAFAETLLTVHPRLQVDLKQALLRVEVEVRRSRAFVSYERVAGPGGLPVGSAGRMLALLSGGIDSPVACYRMLRRGCPLDFVTFHSDPYTPPALIDKVARLTRVLNRYQPTPGRLVTVNLLPVQKAIRDGCRSRFRTVLYRRFMARIACRIAAVLGARALVTGDNIGQVASQTLDNLEVITAASSLMILRPLLAYDKQETVGIAEAIGTLALSNEQVPDSCTVFAPDDPATAAREGSLRADEGKLDREGLIGQCLELTRVVDPVTLESVPLTDLAEATPRRAARGGPKRVRGTSPSA